MTRYAFCTKAVIAAALAALCGIYYFPMNGMRAAQAKMAAPGSSSFENVTVLNIMDTKTLWRAVSREASLSADGLSAAMDSVTINVPSENIAMRADTGSLDMQTNIMELSGNVKSQVKGFDVSTGTVRIVPGQDVSSAPGQDVQVKKRGMSITGKSLEANTQRTVKLKNDVKAIFY
ncbi:MAG: LPS export ABC transporter periplasmic protein LptC [Actinomycetota bacterium]|nr:LPS export ABC transporter periplasmic protein LptC [Actinomycetota bacterium]